MCCAFMWFVIILVMSHSLSKVNGTIAAVLMKKTNYLQNSTQQNRRKRYAWTNCQVHGIHMNDVNSDRYQNTSDIYLTSMNSTDIWSFSIYFKECTDTAQLKSPRYHFINHILIAASRVKYTPRLNITTIIIVDLEPFPASNGTKQSAVFTGHMLVCTRNYSVMIIKWKLKD